jgi:hypothetical protein
MKFPFLTVIALALVNSSAYASEEGIAMSDAKQLSACSRIENLLTNLHQEGMSIENKAFNKASDRLKENFTALCESSSYDAAKLASVERDLDQLDQSLTYLNMLTSKRKGNPKILKPFLVRHNNVCAPGYGYVSWGIWGDRAHQNRASCHNTGDAIDIHAITLNGVVYTGKTQRFRDYVSCMHKEFGTVFGNSSHTDHVHIQLRPCRRYRGWYANNSNYYYDTDVTAELAKVGKPAGSVAAAAPAEKPAAPAKPVVAEAKPAMPAPAKPVVIAEKKEVAAAPVVDQDKEEAPVVAKAPAKPAKKTVKKAAKKKKTARRARRAPRYYYDDRYDYPSENTSSSAMTPMGSRPFWE